MNVLTSSPIASERPAKPPITRDAAVDRAFPCAACKNEGCCSVCMTIYTTESTYEDRYR
jgi:hypothetical protein